MLRHKQVAISGASGTASVAIQGMIEYVKIAYTNGQAGGDLAIADSQFGQSLLTLTNHNTNFDAAIRKQAVDTAGAAITGEYSRLPVAGEIAITTAQQASNTVVTVDIWWTE